MIRPIPLVPVLLTILLLAVSASGMPASPDEPDSPEGTAAAIFTLKVDLDLERTKLARCLAEYVDAERRREEFRDRISDLYVQIGSAVRHTEAPAEDEEDLETLVTRVRSAEQAENAAREDLRRLREQITESRERIRTFQDKIADLRRAAPPEPEGLSGTWDVTLLPNGDRAVFTLRQSGTIISGEYQQDGGWKGSLQGTLVNNKLVLHRIDSKLGSSSDLEATVSTDLRSLKGSWQSRVLSDGIPSTGTWTGRKREPKKKSDASAP